MNKLLICTGVLLCIIYTTKAQDQKVQYKKGSYLYYGQPNIEDNSMFIEEAFNQEKSVIQHISNFIFDNLKGGDFTYAFTQEIPMIEDKFQFSYTLNYSVLQTPNFGMPAEGFADMLLNFRPMLMDKTDWAIVIPRFTLILPTGNAKAGFGDGAWGGQFNLAVTKRLNSRLTTHWNAGYTYLNKKDFWAADLDNTMVKVAEKNQNFYNLGVSCIYLVSDSFNLMLEGLTNSESYLGGNNKVVMSNTSILNPGFRSAFTIRNVQIVPGLGVPLYFVDGNYSHYGGFVYLSIEPDYTK